MVSFRSCIALVIVLAASAAAAVPARADQAPQGGTASRPSPTVAAATATAVVVPADYLIGPEDVLGVLFWREQEMSGDVTVRPDGMITLPLIGEVRAAGMKPDVLRNQIQEAAGKYLTDTNVTVVIRQIHSRKVFITGQVATPGAYALTAPRTVMQLIALAGGLTEYADGENISVMRQEQGGTRAFKFNYKDVAKGKKLQQNITLQPGDTIVVP